MMIRRVVLLIISLLVASQGIYLSHAANLSLVARYDNSGGLKGNLNEVGSLINGRDVCPSANTNSNNVPGCDMSSDVAYDDNDTPSVGSDDSYGAGADLIIRTNDAFSYTIGWAWTDVAGDGEEVVTIEATLPESPVSGVQIYEWESLPGYCDFDTSSISEDKRTLTCVRIDFDLNDVGSYSEDVSIPVRVLGGAPNGTQMGELSTTISSLNATSITDTTKGVGFTVTASPRWDIFNSYRLESAITTRDGIKGKYLHYRYYIWLDEVSGEEDTGVSALGNESLGTDATVTFTHELNDAMRDVEFTSCNPVNHYSTAHPYPYYNESNPDASIATPNGTIVPTCTQTAPGEDLQVTLEHVDLSLNHYPTESVNGTAITASRYWGTMGTLVYFLPITNIQKGNDGILETDDDNTINTSTVITGFDPDGISGTSNFGSNTESSANNTYNRNHTYVEHGVTYHSRFRSITNTKPYSATAQFSGDGYAAVGTDHLTFTYMYSNGDLDINNAELCNVFDANLFEVIPHPTNSARYSDAQLNDGYIAYQMNASTTFDYEDMHVEYASTYVDDSFLASNGGDVTIKQGANVANECGDESVVWYSDPDVAKQNGLGVITKARFGIKEGVALESANRFHGWFAQTAREFDLDGNANEMGSIIVDHVSMRNTETTNDEWIETPYIANDFSTSHSSGNKGDRLFLSGGKGRITKEISQVNVTPGSEIDFQTHPTFNTEDGVTPGFYDEVKVYELLPQGFGYVSGSTTGGANEPKQGECSDLPSDQQSDCTPESEVLIWDLGIREANVVIPDIAFKILVLNTALEGVAETYSIIDTPTDFSSPQVRYANVNMNVSIPASLHISATIESDTRVERDVSPLHFRINIRNGKQTQPLYGLDIIDVLPFEGDGDLGTQFTVGGNTIYRYRSPATSFSGSLTFQSVEQTGECTGTTEYYYTTHEPSTLNLSPVEAMNTNGDDSVNATNWCAGTSTGPDVSCGFTNADVTAVRSRGTDIPGDGICYMDVKMDVSGNRVDNVYSTSAGAFATGVSSPVLSNTSPIIVIDSSIGNKVWFDDNNDGIQDAGELPADGIPVHLLNASGSTLLSTTTDSTGEYIFDELVSGEYMVEIEVPTWLSGVAKKDEGILEFADSDVNADGRTDIFTLEKDTDLTNIDAGLVALSYGGHLWEDANNDGLKQTTESVLSGVELEAYIDSNSNGVYNSGIDALVGTGITNGSGSYSILNLPEGDYNIVVNADNFNTGNILDSYFSSDDSTIIDPDNNAYNDDNGYLEGGRVLTKFITLTNLTEPENDGDHNNSNRTLDLGFYKQIEISNRVWEDTNANGLQDAGEIGLAGVTLNLFDDDDNFIASTVSGADGSYTFSGVNPGKYFIETIVPTGYNVTLNDIGSDDTIDNDVRSFNNQTSKFTLESGDELNDVSIGLYRKASIGDRAWIDSNANNIQDAGEPGLVGVRVYLIDSDGTTQDSVVTDSNGTYLFSNILPGDYTLETEIPASNYIVDKDSGSDDTIDSDFSTTTLTTDTISLESGEFRENVAVGFYEKISIQSSLWLDDNGDGLNNISENGSAGVVINLLDASGNIVDTTTTDANGNYSFDNLEPGTYSLAAVLPSGAVASPKNSGSNESFDSDMNADFETNQFSVISGDVIDDIDLGYYEEITISDSVWEDLDADGIEEAGEPKLAGVVVHLIDSDGNITSTTTDASGNYSFTGLAPGNYAINIETPNGFNTVEQGVGSNTTIDSDIDSDTNITDLLVVTSGETLSNVSAGFYKKATITDTLFLDVNGNGIQDAGDTGYAGVEVILKDTLGNIVDTSTTDTNGQYTFSDVEPGDYILEMETPSDYVISPQDIGANDNVDSDFDIDTRKTEIFTIISSDTIDNITAGIYEKAVISSVVFNDTNKDGIFDDSEEGLAGATVNVYDADGVFVTSTTTDANGEYSLSLDPGTYSLEMISPLGYIISPKDAGVDDTKDSDVDETTGETSMFSVVSSDTVTDLSAGMYIPTGNISSRVFEDMNANGIQDAGELGIEGVTVNLLQTDGTPYKTTTTDENGDYMFADGNYTSGASNTQAGEYIIEFTDIPAGSEFTTQNVGADEDSDSDANTTTGKTEAFTLTDQSSITNIDAGIYTDVVISDTLWLDDNGDGIQNEDETGIDGVTVKLLDTDGNVVDTAVTDSNGDYTFTGVTPDEYVLEIVTDENYGVSDDGLGEGSFDKDTQQTEPITVVSGEEVGGVSSGVYEEATISDTLWLDDNGNGIKDTTEAPMTGVTLNLLDTNGNIVDTAVTDSNGNYTFDEIIPGDYTVEILLEEDFGITDSEGLDGEFDADTLSTDTITLTSGDEVTDMNAGVYEEVTITDSLWLDNNGDGIKGEDEEGLAGVTLNLLDTDGNIVDTAVTDENGEYSFEEVIPGTYIIEIVPEEGFALSENEEGEIDNSLNQSEELILTSGESVPGFQIGIYEEVSISDTLWLDDNGNGIEDANEEGISGILVKLLDAEGNVSQETRTDENGEYSFDGITPGEYSIAIELPGADYHITDDSIGSGEFDSTTLTSQPMTLVSSDNVTNMDTGIYQEVTISDSVWEDSNADGIQDIGEPKLAGVVVKLLDASGEVITSTTTDSNGDYSFTGLAPGNYKVEIETPDNYNTVAQGVGSDTTIDSDIDSTTNTSDLLVVTSNETLSNVTAGFYKKVEISNTLFSDTNGNGIQDAGEIGMSGVVVNLMDSLGNIVDTSTTDENGQYTFSDVEPGDYYIEIESPTDFILAAKDAGEDETSDSDFDPETLKTDIFTVISSGDIADISAGIYKKPIVESVVFDDTNKDGIFDDTEEGLAGVSVNVYDTNGILVDTTTTSGTGEYSLELEPGTYSLEMISPLGYIISPKDSGSNDNVDSDIEETTGTTGTFTVMSSDIVDNISAGMYIPTGNISSRVFEDMNANGIQDAGETGVEGVTVNLLSADGTVYKTTTTNINGEYLFADGDYTSTASNTKSGEYTIEFTDIPTGSEFTTQNVGSDDNADSDADTTSGKTSEFTLTDQTSITNIDAGIYTDVVISDTLWLDNNGDGINNSDEVGLEGVTINLLDTDGNIVDTVVTDENGIYTFEGVTPSEYVLEIVTPDNYGVSDDGLGDGEFDATTQTTTPIVVVSGEEITGVSSGVYEEATISDTLWLDNNGDGIQGEEEVAMTGVTLHLVDVNGNIVDTVVTDENGNYTFDEIIPGDYTVEIDLPEEFGITDSEGLDGEFDADTFSTPTITLVSGQEITDMDAGVYEEVTISDTLWLDNNGDGIKGDDEVGMPGITINLLDTNGNIVDTAVTNEDGQYTFDEVVPGDYSLQIISPTNNVGVINAENGEGEFDGETQTTPIFSTISGETLSGVNAGIYEEASVGSSVWLDVNSDGNQDASEGGFAGADVNLIDNNGNIIQSVITDVNGQYLFEEVIPGEYTIEISGIPGYSVNGDFEGSDVNNTSFQSDVFLVESGVNITEGIIDAALERTSVSNSSGGSSSSGANSSSSVSNNSSASSSSSSSSSVTNSNYVSIKDTPSEAIEHTETATNTTIEVVTPHTELASETIIEKEVLQKNTIDEDTIVMTKIINGEEIEYMLKEDYDHCPIIDNLLDKTYDDNFYSSLGDIESLPNKERVMRMERTGVIDGSKAGDFENFREMSRVEFLKIVIRSHCLEYRNEDTSSLNFGDLDNSDWQAKVVKKSIDLGIANGDQDENGNPIFRADEMITKIEATKILLRMALLQLGQEPDTDYNDLIVDWHDKYVKQGEHLGVFYSEVDNYVFTPESSVTREDMVEFLYSVISLYRADEIAQLGE